MPVGVPFGIGKRPFDSIGQLTFAQLPPAASAAGQVLFVTDVGQGGSLWYSDGTRWNSVSGALPLFALNFGGSGMAINPSAGEVWVGSELLLPAGTVRPGDILLQRVHWQESGTSDSGIRRQHIRVRASPGVTFSDTVLPLFSISSTSPQFVEAFKSSFVSSATFLTSHWAAIPGGHGGSSNVTLTGSGFDANLYLRPSFQNNSTTGTVILYHVSLWLYRGGL